VLQLYLVGLKGVFEGGVRPPYGYFRKLILVWGPVALLVYGTSKYRPEFFYQEQPGLFPRWVYHSRLAHFKFWEMSRLVRGKPATFCYYDYDPNSDFMFYVSDTGVQMNEKSNLLLEKMDHTTNPLFEGVIRSLRESHSAEALRLGNFLVAWDKHKHNPVSLHNYLQYQPVTPGDLLRACFFHAMVKLRLTNHYRMDHFISKSDWQYDFDKLKIGMNSADKGKRNRLEEFSGIFDSLFQSLMNRWNPTTADI
jgi:hypothetical protein